MNFIANETPEKLRGGYYTGADVAACLVRWVREIAPARLLEPSCGDGAFFRALAATRGNGLREVVACEVLPAAAAQARAQATALPKTVQTTVLEQDFLGWSLASLGTRPLFDAAVGNPPFIRYQYLDGTLQARAAALFQRFGLPFTKHTNAWVPFVLGSLALLRPGGRLAMVVPAELLHVLHARPLRSYLLRTCSRVLVLDPEELWFENALQGVVLLLAEKSMQPGDGDARGALAVNRVSGRAFLSEPLGRQFALASFVPGEELGDKWMLGLLTASERGLLRRLRGRGDVRPFRELAHVAVGIVTGANKFFLVPDDTVERYGLAEFAHPMFGRSEHVPGVLYDDRVHQDNRRLGHPTNFLWFGPTRKSELPAGARSYIDRGEAENLHTRYKCRIRSPWYSVPSVFSAPVGMLKRSHHCPRLVLNTAAALTTDTAYRIAPINCMSAMSAGQLVFAWVNSLTALSAELEGRHYGGGVLELVPSEIDRVLVPYVPRLEPALGHLDAMFRRSAPAAEILAVQDRRVLRPLGVRRADCEAVLEAWTRLRARRQRAGAGVG